MQGTDDAANLEGSQGRSDAAVAQKDKQNGKFIPLQTLRACLKTPFRRIFGAFSAIRRQCQTCE
ncbi:MAG: hypothetical protein FWD98_04505, partial [Defluviitaleaceae bacterium]|nr:hypothetical protein [Defluviitaleaceae bacterium]